MLKFLSVILCSLTFLANAPVYAVQNTDVKIRELQSKPVEDWPVFDLTRAYQSDVQDFFDKGVGSLLTDFGIKITANQLANPGIMDSLPPHGVRSIQVDGFYNPVYDLLISEDPINLLVRDSFTGLHDRNFIPLFEQKAKDFSAGKALKALKKFPNLQVLDLYNLYNRIHDTSFLDDLTLKEFKPNSDDRVVDLKTWELE